MALPGMADPAALASVRNVPFLTPSGTPVRLTQLRSEHVLDTNPVTTHRKLGEVQ